MTGCRQQKRRAVARDRAGIEALRARIRAIELGHEGAGAVVTLGVAEVDAALPWGGLPRGAVHEIAAGPPLQPSPASGRGSNAGEEAAGAAATGFAAALAGRLAAGRAVLWCLARGDLYAPGLPAFGLDPARLLLVRTPRPEDALWAAEEGLRSGALAAVVCEAAADLAAGRRLQLAARAHETACLLLAPAPAATTRWRIAPLAGGSGWRVTLERCRGGPAPRHWNLGWDHETGGFAVAAPLADRPRPPPAALAERRRAG